MATLMCKKYEGSLINTRRSSPPTTRNQFYSIGTSKSPLNSTSDTHLQENRLQAIKQRLRAHKFSPSNHLEETKRYKVMAQFTLKITKVSFILKDFHILANT